MGEYYIEWISERMREFGMEFFLQNVKAETVGARAHIHDSIEIIYICEGNFNIFVNDTKFFAQRGDVLLFRSNTIHSILANSAPLNTYYVLKVKPELLLELASKKNAASYVLRFSAPLSSGKTHWKACEVENGEIEHALDLLIREYQAEALCKDLALKVHSCQVILALLKDLMREEHVNGMQVLQNDSATEQIYRATTYIHKNFGENLNAALCSKMANMSYSYFSRCFKRVTGRSFKTYLNETRINYAEHLLATTSLSVTEIALECGYNNVSYFITVYKELKKRTPLADREKHREEELLC